MKVLVAGYAPEDADALTAALREGGHQVLAAGRHNAAGLAESFATEAVLVPAGEGELHERLATALPQVPLIVAEPGDDLDGLLGPATRVVEPEAPRHPPFAARLEETTDPDRPAMPDETEDVRSSPNAMAIATRPARRSTGRHEAAGDSPDIAAKLADVRFGDYHSILELSPGTSEYVIREQYQQLARLYSPAGWPGTLTPGDVEALLEIGRGLRDAFTVLGDAELRTRYERAPGLGPRTAG